MSWCSFWKVPHIQWRFFFFFFFFLTKPIAQAYLASEYFWCRNFHLFHEATHPFAGQFLFTELYFFKVWAKIQITLFEPNYVICKVYKIKVIVTTWARFSKMHSFHIENIILSLMNWCMIDLIRWKFMFE